MAHRLAFAVVLSFAVPALAGPDDGVQWVEDLHAARDAAVGSGKPILIVFGAEWCVYCKKMEQTTLSHGSVSSLINERFVPIHLDVTEKAPTPQKRIADILEVKTLPCAVVLSPEADLLGRITGYQSPSRMYEQLTAAERLNSTIRTAGGTK